MVTFNCEACNDTVIKKKLDQHKNQCWNAQFTCIDCNTTFAGTDYRGHTSCITEAQKYQGKLYRGEKQKGNQRNQRNQQGGKANGFTPGTSTNSAPLLNPREFGKPATTDATTEPSTPSAPPPALTIAVTPTTSRLKKDGMPQSPIRKNVVFAYPIKEERVFDKNVPMSVPSTPKKEVPAPVAVVKDVVVTPTKEDKKADSEKKDKKDKKDKKADKKADKKSKSSDKTESKKEKKRKHADSDDETPATPSKKSKSSPTSKSSAPTATSEPAAIPETLVKAFAAVSDSGKKNTLKDWIKVIGADGKKTKKEILAGLTVSKRTVDGKEEIVLTIA